MHTVFYIAATCFSAIVSPSSGSRHQHLFNTTIYLVIVPKHVGAV